MEDILESGPERAPRTPVRSALRARRPSRPPSGARRLLVVVVGVAVAAGVMLTLRAGTQPVDEAAPSAGRTLGPSVPPDWYGRVGVPMPPFDDLPGRTPIPDPSVDTADRRLVAGALPAVGDRTPTKANANTAARLVLGRYCRRPATYSVDVTPSGGGWQWVRARVTRAESLSSPRVEITLRLQWDTATRTYAWDGSMTQLDTCG